MVTGGQRSGKSLFAEKLALGLAPRPLYLATARVLDEEMGRRVEAHRLRRANRWRNIEEPLRLSQAPVAEGDVVLVDCLTLWASNWFFDCGCDVDAAFRAMRAELDNLFAIHATLIFVTNEIGLGGVSENRMQRQFADLQGLANQYVAATAQEVYLAVSGIPVKIKPSHDHL